MVNEWCPLRKAAAPKWAGRPTGSPCVTSRNSPAAVPGRIAQPASTRWTGSPTRRAAQTVLSFGEAPEETLVKS
ncbi:MAG: hypothetical protein QOK06_315 [Acidimicrobiaceae bacterium]